MVVVVGASDEGRKDEDGKMGELWVKRSIDK